MFRFLSSFDNSCQSTSILSSLIRTSVIHSKFSLSMPFRRPSISLLLPYTILGLISIALLLTSISFSTTHWIHSHRIRAGFWKRCHLHPSVCYSAITRSPIALTISALILLIIGFVTTLLFDLLKYRLSYARRHLAFLSLGCLSLSGLFLLLSLMIFIGLTKQFCYSFYLMAIGQWLIMNSVALASYLLGRRQIPTSPPRRTTRLDLRRVWYIYRQRAIRSAALLHLSLCMCMCVFVVSFFFFLSLLLSFFGRQRYQDRKENEGVVYRKRSFLSLNFFFFTTRVCVFLFPLLQQIFRALLHGRMRFLTRRTEIRRKKVEIK